MSQLQIPRSPDPLASLRIDRSQEPPSGSGWAKTVSVLLVLSLLGGAAAYGWIVFAPQWLRTTVKTVSAKVELPGAADSVLSAQGYLKSRRQAAIGAKVPGRIIKLYKDDGDHVNQGEDIAELDHADLDASLKAMEAGLKASEAALAKSRAELAESASNLAQDQKDLARYADLYRKGAASGSEYERAQTRVNASRSRVQSLEAAVALADAQVHEREERVNETRKQIENYFVRAPLVYDENGAQMRDVVWTVISKESEVGETIMIGGMGGQSGRGSVVTLADLNNLEVEADVKEDYVGRVSVGQAVMISVDAVKDRGYKGKVRTIIMMGDRARGTIKVKVKILDADRRLIPETSATVRFMKQGQEAQSGSAKPLIYAPADAVKTDSGGSFVWQVLNDRVKRLPIEPGESRDGWVLVESGLKGGEQLVVNPPDSLEPDRPVKVIP